MKRLLLALLAVSCASRAHEPPRPPVRSAVADERPRSFPPFARHGAFRALRFGMTRDDVMRTMTDAAFARSGDRFVDGPWELWLVFSAGTLAMFSVAADPVSEDDVRAALAALAEEAPVASATERIDARFGPAGRPTPWFVMTTEPSPHIVESYARRGATGDVGIASLVWGMDKDAVVRALAGAGFSASSPEDDVVVGEKDGDELTAALEANALTDVTVSGPTGDHGRARLSQLEALHGRPTSIVSTTTMEHHDRARRTRIEVKVVERRHTGARAMFVTYEPER